MPTALPSINDLQGVGTTPTSDAFRAAIGQQHTFISEKLGTSGSNSDAQTALGASTLGKSIFGIADSIALAKLLGAGSISPGSITIKVLLGNDFQAQIGSNIVTTTAGTSDSSGLATITFPEEFFTKLGSPAPAQYAIVSLGNVDSMSPIAPVHSSYTSTTMQIKSAASVTIRVNWIAIAQY